MMNSSKLYVNGYFDTNEDTCRFVSGKNIITVTEHFNAGRTAEELLENVIRYERGVCDLQKVS